jgi:hypothetical protein
MMILLGGGGNLFTKAKFEDFILVIEWRPKRENYNSGIFVRGPNQINLAQKQVGQLLNGGKGSKAVPELHNPVGQWNTWEIACVGTKLSLKVNGKQAWEITDFKPTEGPVGIQAEGAPIDFRNLRIKKLAK